MKLLVLTVLAAALFPLAHSDIWQELDSKKPKDNQMAELVKYTDEISKKINADQPTDSTSFYKAAGLMKVPFFNYRTQRVRYELLLAAAASGNADAKKELAEAWDRLLVCLGRPMRTDAKGLVEKNSDYFILDSTPSCIKEILLDPTKKSVVLNDNLEIKEVVDEDQAARKNFAKMTPKDLQEMQKDDQARIEQVKRAVLSGNLHTSNDYANAALVLQHSTRFDGYQLAHELAVCSMLLGDKGTGRWLIAASYDRMLNSVGHDQRFGTQYGIEGLKRTDEEGICDSERKALGCPTLAQARQVKLL